MPFKEIALPVCDVSRPPNGTYCCIAREKHVPSYIIRSLPIFCADLFLTTLTRVPGTVRPYVPFR